MSRSSRSERITAAFLRRWPLPAIDPKGSKDARGAVLVIAGAPEMPGAAILAATAALRAGAGKLQIATVRSVASLVAAQVPEALVMGFAETRHGGFAAPALRELAKRAESAGGVLIGPGMVDSRATAALAVGLLERLDGCRLVLDAEALEACRVDPAAVRGCKASVAITPHAKEMAHLLDLTPGEVARDPRGMAVRAAESLGVVAALKGAETFLADPAGRVLVNRDAGNAGLGTSGSGDTLSGIVAGLAARGADALQACAWGVYVHGRAGDVLARRIGPVGYLARELLAEVPRELARFKRR